MAKVWPVYEGKEPTRGGPWAELPFAEAIDLFELRQQDFVSDLAETPHFGNSERTLYYQGFKYIVVEVNINEARRERWRPGFYKSRVSPQDAFGRLIKNAFETALGKENIIRIEYSSATDSRGQEALHITTVIPPNAARNLRQGATLDALVKLQERLREMREERTPIVEYATEAELAENAGH